MVADDQGRWELSAHIPDLPLGRYAVTTNCSPTPDPITVDVVGAAIGTGTSSGAGAAVSGVLLFFVLLAQASPPV